VDATVHNGTGAAVSVVEVDYPSASFGTTSLAAGADFHYRFKILGNGPTKATWTDAMRQDHSSTGPTLVEGSEGPMIVTLTAKGAQWDVRVKKIH